MTVDLIVNPASGPARRLPRAQRLHFVSGLLRTRGVEVRGRETAGHGDAARLVAAARDEGTDLVLVWGGDGTVNEAASRLLDTGSEYDVAFVPGRPVYITVATYNRAQTRHSEHITPVQVMLQP